MNDNVYYVSLSIPFIIPLLLLLRREKRGTSQGVFFLEVMVKVPGMKRSFMVKGKEKEDVTLFTSH